MTIKLHKLRKNLIFPLLTPPSWRWRSRTRTDRDGLERDELTSSIYE